MRKKIGLLLLVLVASLAAPMQGASSANPQIQSNIYYEGNSFGPVSRIYLDVFHPGLNAEFTIPAGSSIITESTSATAMAELTGTKLTFTLPRSLNVLESGTAYVAFHSGGDNRDYLIYTMPRDLNPLYVSGDTSAITEKTFLYTPGKFAVAQRGNEIQYFERASQKTFTFQKVRKPFAWNNATVTYAFLVKSDLKRATTQPGFWVFLDENFVPVGNLSSVALNGAKLTPEGHDMTVSPSGNPVILSYLPRQVDNTWIAQKYETTTFDCILSEVDQNSKSVHAFSLWEYVNGNRKAWKPVLDKSEIAKDSSANYTATDWCHVNSVTYEPRLSSYIVSFRSIDRILLIDKNLKKVTADLVQPDARQHYARSVSGTTITAFGNYTSQKSSRMLTWNLVKKKWVLKTTELPLHMLYCGNLNVLDKKTIFVGGGCGTTTPKGFGWIITATTKPWSIVGSLEGPAAGATYRVEFAD